MDNSYSITVDVRTPGTLELVLEIQGTGEVDRLSVSYSGPVDNLLLTGIDNLLNRNRLHKFALKAVRPGQGVDKNSSLYRMVQSFATAITAANSRP
jgi:hypothetical protein